MDRGLAEKITTTINKIRQCELFLKSLKGRGYEDEFQIYYRGMETCELEPDALKVLIVHYENKLNKFEDELKNIK